jgi:hypothetical protein
LAVSCALEDHGESRTIYSAAISGYNGHMAIHRQWVFVIYLGTLLTAGCEGDSMGNFFEKYSQSELGTTKIVSGNGVVGLRGEMQKMLNVSVEDKFAVPVDVSVRAEYSITAAGVQTVGGPLVGLLQWGIGGGTQQVEFDIPTARLPIIRPNPPLGQVRSQCPTYDQGRGVVHLEPHIFLFTCAAMAVCLIQQSWRRCHRQQCRRQDYRVRDRGVKGRQHR